MVPEIRDLSERGLSCILCTTVPRYIVWIAAGHSYIICSFLTLTNALTFSVLVANPKEILYTVVANPARGLQNRKQITKRETSGGTPPFTLLVRKTSKNNIHEIKTDGAYTKDSKKGRWPERGSRDAYIYTTQVSVLRRSRSVSRLYRISLTRQLGEQNFSYNEHHKSKR